MELTEELLELERAAWDANLAGDADYYDRLLLGDAIVVSPWGVQDKAAIVAGIKANAVPYTGYELDLVQSRRLGADAALLTYRAVVRGERAGEPFTHTVYATSVQVRVDGRWRASFYQQSLVAGAGGG
jgi:uncharacterized protein DUF4440